MVGYSQATAQSYQDASQVLGQQYRGTCDFSCTNIQSGDTIVIDNSHVTGGIHITQKCSVDATCLMQSTTDATASVFFSATNSTTAGNAGGWLSGIGNVDIGTAASYQDIRQQMSQQVQQTSKMTTTNDLNNIMVYVANDSTLDGGIEIGQEGENSGQVTMNNMMQGYAEATGEATNSAESGKKAMTTAQWLEMLGVGVLVIVIIVIVVGVIHYFKSTSKTQQPSRKGKFSGGEEGGLIIYSSQTPPTIATDEGGNLVINPSRNPPPKRPEILPSLEEAESIDLTRKYAQILLNE